MAYNQFYNPYPQQMNPTLMNQQMRLQQMEQMYPQYAQPQIQMPQQAMQMPQQPSVLNGRVIDNIESVMASEVSMDGSISIFPMKDMQSIYAKQWQADGTIKTIKYTVCVDTNNESSNEKEQAYRLSDEFTGNIMKRFDELEEKIDGLTKKPAKKEVEK